VSATLVNDVVPDLHVPARRSLRRRIEHVGQEETLGGDRRIHRGQLLLLLLNDSLSSCSHRSDAGSLPCPCQHRAAVESLSRDVRQLHAGAGRKLSHQGQTARGAKVNSGPGKELFVIIL